jgi:hypothetical protein
MGTTTRTQLTGRDRAVLRAIAEGRCTVEPVGSALRVDGFFLSDQFTAARLARAGLITAAGTVRLTVIGRTRLAA